VTQQTVPVALWLVPASPWHQRLHRLIEELAGAFASAVFEPHITLHVGAVRRFSSVSAELSKVAASHPTIALTCGATKHGSEHFKTLFVTFDDTRLEVLRQALMDAADLGGMQYQLRPHLSLLYRGDLDSAERGRLASIHSFEGEPVIFEELVLVRPVPPSDDLFDLDRLDTKQRFRLSGQR
jgi:Cyclic phosphodiesterase-like protein